MPYENHNLWKKTNKKVMKCYFNRKKNEKIIKEAKISGLFKSFGPILGYYTKRSPRNSWSPHFMIILWIQKSRNVGNSCIAEHLRIKWFGMAFFSAFFANTFVLQTQLDLHSALVVFQVLDAIQFEHNIQNLGLQRGAFCQFPFWWI